MTPEEVWQYVNTVPGWFGRLNAEKLYEVALKCPGVMAEIGVSEGRSASALLLAARHTGASVLLVDNWSGIWIELQQNAMTRRIAVDFPDVRWTVKNQASLVAALTVPDKSLSLVHIDANHECEHPEEDCRAWLPKLVPGGVACFHDYGDQVPAVTIAVDKHTAQWEDLGNWESLAIRRKPA